MGLTNANRKNVINNFGNMCAPINMGARPGCKVKGYLKYAQSNYF